MTRRKGRGNNNGGANAQWGQGRANHGDNNRPNNGRWNAPPYQDTTSSSNPTFQQNGTVYNTVHLGSTPFSPSIWQHVRLDPQHGQQAHNGGGTTHTSIFGQDRQLGSSGNYGGMDNNFAGFGPGPNANNYRYEHEAYPAILGWQVQGTTGHEYVPRSLDLSVFEQLRILDFPNPYQSQSPSEYRG
ncbi:hypothetical protein MKZ38_004428 [Zalerion maritima]|uniref:Uncharacterized protein n=1 Tax=Zalerion maritima TaxID=339359 RepID=A0AAD5RXY4_9PEZI|nr:hypothetical protein MKZ38_004428 [Zalerion maritima]